MADLAPDTLVDGRYRVISRLGSGGMADVYLATDAQLGRSVALKLLYPRFAQDEEFVERFRREASSAAGLSHPNVVNVYDRGEWDGTYYIAMEYLDGRSLKTVIAQEGALDPVVAIDLVSQILRAARSAHQRGVIHRDLKPHNAIVDADGVVKVTDFGIARAGASDMTETGSIMGTAQYLSPEQAQGHAVGAPSDLYSIGIVLYELLAGMVPFDGTSAVTVALKQVTEPPVAPSVANPAVTAQLDAVVLRALAKDPEQRFADASEFLAALEVARVAQINATGPATAHFAAVAAPALYEAPVVADAYAPVATQRRAWPWVLATALLIGAGLAALLLLGSSGRAVPDVIGQPEPVAAATLMKAQFHVLHRTHPSAAVPDGHVIATFPGPRADAPRGSTVTLIVSSGPGLNPVPNVVSLGRRAAAQSIKQAGFAVIEQTQSSDLVPRDHVIATDPPPLTEARSGSPVTLVVSSGRPRLTVPNVVGQSYDQASAALQAAGFQVARSDQATSSQKPSTVIREVPAPGSTHTKGSTVRLIVAKQNDQVTVPAVVGLHEADATAAIAAAGLRPATTSKPVSDPGRDGIVLRQQPPAGSQARRGSSVALVVGHLTPGTNTTPAPTPTTQSTTPSPNGPQPAPPKAPGP